MSIGKARGSALAGAVLAAASLPGVAGSLVAAFGQPALRPVSLDRLVDLATGHVSIAAGGLAVMAILGVGLGVLATRAGALAWRGEIDRVAAFAQAVPPVVVVALALPVLGFGGPPTLLALVAYGIMPVLRGTIGAIEGVPTDAREAGRAIGLSDLQVLRQVELPLAAPGILDALRTGLVLAVATAAVGALAGAATLGTPIVAGLQNQNLVPLLQGACATAALAFLCDAAMLAVAGLLRRATRP
ncbi:ABC transporter permease [Methylobacterium sp. Leaf399]|uniref:ABC transporter permease n=1 Tax=Methylobacterium sp. Leaf399 TaxID=1736364 RepID=UPI0006FBEB19|nr:ABC transporter permease subunit [Methylobacterium sp. Leaf399]KQT11691.1 ABC transporter permease [Methylobacterium sp. Leaf399]